MVVPFGINKTTVPTKKEKEMAGMIIRKKHNIRPEEKILLFSGSLDYEPNAAALKTIVQTILPTLQSITDEPFRVIACGRILFSGYSDLYSLKHEKYIYAGLVDDIDPYFLAADLFINPVTDGGGIKVKMMDALAFNLPVVCTTHSVKGINKIFTGEKLYIAEDGDWENFSRLIPVAWKNTGAVPDRFYEEYHWSRVIRPVAEKIASL